MLFPLLMFLVIKHVYSITIVMVTVYVERMLWHIPITSQGKLDAQSKLRSVEAYVAQLQEVLDEEQEAKSILSKQLAAASSDAVMWKTKMEGEATLKIEELEDAKWVTFT